jgi:hypothetical protein
VEGEVITIQVRADELRKGDVLWERRLDDEPAIGSVCVCFYAGGIWHSLPADVLLTVERYDPDVWKRLRTALELS